MGKHMGAVNPLAHLDAEWLGVDPGKTNMATVAHEERSAEIANSRATQAAKTWLAQLKPQLNALSHVSSKPSSLASYQRFANTVVETYDAKWAELIKQAKKRWPDRILALAYGAAGFSSSGSIGCRGVQVSQMLEEALRQFPAGRVVMVDEFRTSRVSSAYSNPTLPPQCNNYKCALPHVSMQVAAASLQRGEVFPSQGLDVLNKQQRQVSTGLTLQPAIRPGISPCAEVQIMKSDEDVRMISAEAPVLFAKRLQACEMFILELTLRAWQHAEENKRRTLQRNDVAAAITRTDIFDFLLDVVPREDLKLEDGASNALANTPASAAVPPPQGLAPSPTQASMPAPPTPPAPHMASAASMSMQQPPLGGWCPTSLAHGCLPVEHNTLYRSASSRWWLSLRHAGMSMYPAFPMYPGAPGGMGQGMDPSHMMMGMGPPFMGMPGQPWPGAMPGVMHGMPGMPGGMPGMPPGMHGMPPGMHGMHLMQGPMGGMHPGMHPGPGMQPGPHGGMQPGAQGMSGQHNAAKTSNPLSEGKSS
ncbi:hypothetical protein QJQ45_018474 [Haematococcus lacustris]|nr:hypothetical protein QJQ45_018474 [Haematococcus lacustris]